MFPQRICLDLSLSWCSCWKRNVFPQRTCPDLGLSWSSSWTWKVFPQRICPGLGLRWYRCNRQYVQGSGKLVLKLPGIRVTAPPHLHPFHGHGAFSSRGRCLATSATKTHTEEEKGHGRRGWVFLGSRGALDPPCWTPAPPASPPSRWACSFHLLGACQRGAPKTPSWGWQWVSWMPGTRDPAAGRCTVDKDRPH